MDPTEEIRGFNGEQALDHVPKFLLVRRRHETPPDESEHGADETLGSLFTIEKRDHLPELPGA